MKSKLLALMCIISMYASGQGYVLPNTYVSALPNGSTYTGPNMVVFDRLGNQKLASDLVFQKQQSATSSFPVSSTCIAGIFRLHFKDAGTGSGFDGPNGNDAKIVACKVYTDISALLKEANSPYSNISDLGNGNYVEIEVKKSLNNSSDPSLANGDQYYLQASKGIVHGTVWQTINSGIDGWFGTTNTFLNSKIGLYHGYLQLNFGHDYYYGDDASQIPSTDYDFYTTVLHEAMHSLGFGSLISNSGESKISPGIYSNYDNQLINVNGNQKLLNNTGCYESIFNSNVPLSDLSSPCTIYFNGLSNNYVTTPSIWSNEISLSHFSFNDCGNAGKYVLSPNLGSGQTFRYFDNEEIQMLHKLGYETSYGGSIVSGANDYATYTPAGIGVRFSTPFNTPIAINTEDILNNDHNVNYFDCLQPINNCGTVNITSGSFGTKFIFTPATNFTGTAFLKYIPYDQPNGKAGNITYVSINIALPPTPACSVPACEMVCYGDFEAFSGQGDFDLWTSLAPNPFNFVFAPFPPSLFPDNTPDFQTSPVNILPFPTLPCSSSPFVPVNAHSGNNFVGLIVRWDPFTTDNNNPEGPAMPLNTPINPGECVTVRLWARLNSDNCNASVAISFSENIPCDWTVSELANCPGINISPSLQQPLVGNTSAWRELTYTYTNNTGNPLNFLYINTLQTVPFSFYHLWLDDVSCVKNSPVVITKTGPAAACTGDTIQYTIEVCDTNSCPAMDVSITDVLPSGLAALPTSTFNFPTQVVGTIQAGACVSYTIDAVVTATSGTISNIATAAAGACLPIHTADTSTLTVNNPALTLSSNSNPSSPCPGDTFAFNLTICNTSLSPVSNVIVQSVLPIGYSAVPGVGYIINGQNIDFTSINLPAGAIGNPACTTLVVNLISGPASGNIISSILVGSGACNTLPNILDIVICNNPFIITKTSNPTSTYAGHPVTFTITITNNTPNIEFVTITDIYPQFFIPTGSTPNSCPGPNPPCWLFPDGVPVTNFPINPGTTTYTLTGYYTDIAFCPIPSHTNTIQMVAQGQTYEAEACVTIRRGCPMVVWGISDCVDNNPVYVSHNIHSGQQGIYKVEYNIVYPEFISPPTPGSLAGFLSLPLGTAPLPYDFTPNGATTYYNGLPTSIGTPTPHSTVGGVNYFSVPVRISFSPAINLTSTTTFGTIEFTNTNIPPRPAGQYSFLCAISSPSAGANKVDLYINGNTTNPLSLWCQGTHFNFTCPGAPVIDKSFTVTQAACDPHGSVTVEATNSSQTAVHLWEFGDNRSTPINGPQLTNWNYLDPYTDMNGYTQGPAAPGTYTITHTITDNGVSAIETQVVTISPFCCSSLISIPDGASASELGLTSLTGTVSIQGTFIVDQNLDFTNAIVKMETASQIVVSPGVVLTIDNSNISACNYMWKGILVKNEGYIIINNSSIYDAQYAIDLEDRTIATIDNTIFERNFVGIRTSGNPLDYNNINLSVSQCQFRTGSGLVTQFTNQSPTPTTKSFAGMQLADIGIDLTNAGLSANIFEDMSNGIIGSRINIDATNCKFNNIQPDPVYNNLTAFNGSGIYNRGGHGYFYIRQIGFGKYAATSTYNNCYYGITGEAVGVNCNNIRMTNMTMGFRIDYSNYMSLLIQKNYIQSKKNGIDLRYNDNAKMILVENNEIRFGHLSMNNIKGSIAINVIEKNGQNNYAKILNNVIHYNQQGINARIGIMLNSTNNYTVEDNQLFMTNNANNLYGIYSFGSYAPDIKCNTINGSGNNYTNKYQSAIKLTLNKAPNVSCNSVDKTYNGIYFSGTNYGTDVKGNVINTHINGLHLDNYAIIGNQDYKGNLWSQQAIGGGLNAVYDNAVNALIYNWSADPTSVLGNNPIPMNSSPAGWINPVSGTSNFTCINHGKNYCSNSLIYVDDQTFLDEQIASGLLQNNPFPDETKWILESELYEKLDKDPSLMVGDQTLIDFYNSSQAQLYDQFQQIEDADKLLFDLDQTVLNNLEKNNELLKASLFELNEQLKLFNDGGLTYQETLNLKASINTLQQTIKTLLKYSEVAIDLAVNTRKLAASSTKAANESLNANGVVSENDKLITGIYLKTIGSGIYEFSTEEKDAIISVAQQCPVAGGPSVAVARGMYAMIDDEMDYDDEAICLQSSIVLRNSNNQILSSENTTPVLINPFFIPNPARNSATFVYQLEEAAVGTLILTDEVGHVMLSQNLNAAEVRTTVSTGSLQNGVYFFRLLSNDVIKGKGKLIIIK